MPASAKVIPFPSRGADPDNGPKRGTEALRKQYQQAVGAKQAENQEAAEAERYSHSVQWSEKDAKVLEDRGQAPIVFNRIKRKINTISGILEKLRQDPKAYPRTPSQQAQDGAELCTNVIRYALGWDWDDLSNNVGRRGAVRGISGAEIVILPGDQGDPEIDWDEVDQRDYFYDPKSYKHDFSDARFMGTTRWLDLDEAIDNWPEYEDDLKEFTERSPTTSWERGDERMSTSWYNPREKQVRIVDHWYMVGKKWYYTIYCGDVALEWGESPFIDEKKRSVSKFEMMSYDVDQDGDRYAAYRDLRGAQDEINQRRSKALYQLNSRKVIAEEGAVDDVETARREYARADGWVVKNPGREIITEDAQAAAVVQGNLDMLAEAKAEIDTFGPNPGLIGSEIPAESGRAIQLLQAAGIAELGTYIRSYRNWKLRVYRKTWNACQQFWKEERWIRVTDDENLASFIQVNGWERDEFGRPVVINQLAALDVDVILDEGPDTINTMAEIFDLMLALAKAGAQIPPQAIIEMSGLPATVKKQIIQKMQPEPMQQQALQLQFEQLAGQVALLQSQVLLNQAKAQQAGADAQKKTVEANTPEPGAPPQVDTPADLAKADLDLAKADEIRHKIDVGAHVPEVRQPPPPQPADPGLFELNLAKTRREHAQASVADAQAAKTILEARTISEAPPGMLTQPPPQKPAPGAKPRR